MTDDLEDKQHFVCDCHSDEHTIVFTYDEMDQEVYLSVFLETTGFFGRLWNAVKYVCGYKCRYGHFGNWILKKKDVERLQNLLQRYAEDMKRGGDE